MKKFTEMTTTELQETIVKIDEGSLVLPDEMDVVEYMAIMKARINMMPDDEA